MKIWQRYFLRQWLGVFFLFLFCFYGLYILIDYASHTGTFHHQHVKLTWGSMALYYAAEFVKRLDIILPFGILIATVRTLCMLNSSRELVALMASGIKLKVLLRPFVVLGLIGATIIFLNSQFLLPYALGELKIFNTQQALKHSVSNKYPEVRHLTLEDGTPLLFYHYDNGTKKFFDVYWIRSIDELYRMKTLDPHGIIPEGVQVDHIVRNGQGELKVIESLPRVLFKEMLFSEQGLLETITPPEELALNELWEKLPYAEGTLSEKDAQKLTVFYRKLAMPWLCLFAVLGPAPFCVQFTRRLQAFFIYAGSIFGLVAAYLVMNAATVLGERQVLPPGLAIWTPFALIGSILVWRYYGQFRFKAVEWFCSCRG